MKHNIYLYILVMAAVTYLIRVLPLTLIKKEIKNNTERKQTYLFYVQNAFTNNKIKIEKMTLTRYFYQMLNA